MEEVGSMNGRMLGLLAVLGVALAALAAACGGSSGAVDPCEVRERAAEVGDAYGRMADTLGELDLDSASGQVRAVIAMDDLRAETGSAPPGSAWPAPLRRWFEAWDDLVSLEDEHAGGRRGILEGAPLTLSARAAFQRRVDAAVARLEAAGADFAEAVRADLEAPLPEGVECAAAKGA